jgi:aspartate/methionine/tyrosine aminotransferase
MVLKVAARGAISPFIVMDVLRAANERAASGADVLHLEVGQPGTPAPAPVIEAARRALDSDLLGYTDALGIPALRQGIAAHYRAQYGVELDPARVVVTTGSSGGFLLSFLAAFDPGDRVALAAPKPSIASSRPRSCSTLRAAGSTA